MKNFVILLLSTCVSVLAVAFPAVAEPNMQGQWLTYIYDSNNAFNHHESWSLTFQFGPAIKGSGSNGSFTWTSIATINDNFEFGKVDTFNLSSFAVIYQGILNQEGTQVTGTWADNLGSTGSFISDRIAPIEFKPGLTIVDAPNITIEKKTITITMEKFSKALPKNAKNNTRTARFLASQGVETAPAKAAKITILYEINIKGATRQQTRKTVTSKRNQVTVKNLVPGNYTTSYKVKAIQNEKTLYSTRPSPKAIFNIAG